MPRPPPWNAPCGQQHKVAHTRFAKALSDISRVAFHLHLLTSCSAVSHHHERVLLEFADRRSAGSYTPKSRSISLLRNSPRQQRFSLSAETSTFIEPSGRHPTGSYTLSDGGCEPSTPPETPSTLSVCPKSYQIVAAPHQHQAKENKTR